VASVFEAILSAVKTRIDGLGLTFGGAPVPVVVAKAAEVKDLRHQLPRVWVTPGGAEPSAGQIAFGYTGMEYAVDVTFVARANKDQHLNLERWLDFRQQIRREFERTKLAGVPEVWNIRVAPGDPADPSAFDEDHDRGTVGLVFHSAEPMGG
jgi:hypothetical protein